MSDPAFTLEAVSCRFGSLVAIDELSLEIGQGEQVALIGPSGSGKTTLLRLMNTMRAPDAGRVFVFGEDVARFSARRLRKLRSRIATIPQHLGLVPNLTVLQNIVLGRGGKRGSLRSVRDILFTSKADVLQIHEILDRVGIEEKLYSRTSSLSGGQQQRVAIARALFQEPDVLIADEPVSSVDPARARDTVALLYELSRELGFTLCVSIHHVNLATEFFPRLVGLRAGKKVFDSTPEELEEETLKTLFELSREEMMEDA